jgi:SAM-dependent methyltransferase
MSQDHGPIQEPQKIPLEEVTNSRSLGEFTEKTSHLPPDIRFWAAGAGLDLENLMRRWKEKDSWGQLQGKRVLDLASGSTNDPKFKPFFARLCAFNGADVTVVDINPQSESDPKISGVTADIIAAVVEGKLTELLGFKKFDVIHSSSFIGFNPPMEVLQKLDELKIAEEDFEKEFFNQTFDLLEEGGALSLGTSTGSDFHVWTKRERAPVLL